MTPVGTEVYPKGNIIYIVSHGRPDARDIKLAIAKFQEEVKAIEAEGQRPVCLVDLSDNQGYDTEARKVATDSMKNGSVPTAITGMSKNVALQTVVNFMIRLSGHSEQYKFFQSKEKAETWLKSIK